MTFTLQEIDNALNGPDNYEGMYFSTNAGLSKSMNYSVITDYLTGKHHSLQGIQHDDKIYYWGVLTTLLTDVEHITPKQQLLLDVLFEPNLFPYVSHYFNHWLLLFFFKKKTDSAFQAVLVQFKKQGMTDNDIFNYCLANVSFDDVQEIGEERTGLIDFLLNHIRQSSTLIYPSKGTYNWGNSWNLFYFKLLEEAGSPFIEDYIFHGLEDSREHPVVFLFNYKGGKYLSGIISFISDFENGDYKTIQTKFDTAARLCELDEQNYLPTALRLATAYLSSLGNKPQGFYNEGGLHLAAFKGTDLEYLPLTSYAFHLLLKHNRAIALEMLNDLMKRKVFIDIKTLLLIHHYLQQDAFPYFKVVLKSDVSRSYLGGIEYFRFLVTFVQQHFEPAKCIPLIWELSSSKSKPLRELVAAIIAEKDADAEERAIELLQNKNAETKLTAAIILSLIATPSAKAAIMKVLNTETNDNARDVLLQTVADNLPTQASVAFIEEMVNAAKARGKLNKPVEAWLEESTLSKLFYNTGKELTTNETRFLLYRMSRIKEMRSDMEARYILQFLDKEKSNDFALEIIKLFIDKGSKPEHKWLMALAALLGNDAVVDKIRITINKWIDDNRYKMAEHGVGALALQGSDKALRWVEWYSRKYKSKKANVGAAALVALETAAEEQGITIHELGDRVVPDFGFDGLFKNFTTDGEEYRAFIDSNFKMAFFNEDNKKLKAIPAATDATIKEEFKAVAKEVRGIVKSQSSRLEYYLIIQRKWSFQQWQQFFLRNPVMFIYATKLLWGVYNESGNLQQTFMCSEDTSLMDVNNEEINLDENSLIGIVHPTGLSEASLQQWQQQFYDLSVDPVFPQLDRKTPDLKNIDLSKPIIKVFEGKQMQTGSTRGTLERFGWHKGPTGDGGILESFNLLYFEKKIEAVLEVDGIGAGYGWGMDEKLGRLYIIDKTKVTSKWGVYIKNEEDENLVELSSVPIIFLSEMLAAVQSIKPFEKKD